ncbi:MAG TPA: aldo/keto reductase [Calditrichia bacterium]|nr:aldo/keto reductase [Calditrichia bacterium]
MSEVAFGCMSLGSNFRQNQQILHQALDGGINFFDTADLYQQGENETCLGRVFKDRRQEVVIATKVGNQLRADGSGWDWNPRKDYILSAVEDSLRRLQTDYIDLYQLHGGTIDDPTDETIEAFEMLKAAGKIRWYGISSIRPNVIRRFVERSQMVSVMMQYSLLDRRPEESCFPLLQDAGVGVIVRGALARGLLAGKTPTSYLNLDRDRVENAAYAVKRLSQPDRNPAQTALQFALGHPAVTTVAAGIRTAAQLRDALGAAECPGLTEEERQKLSGIAPAQVYEQHR